MPLFGKSQKSPGELVKALREAVLALERGDKKAEKVSIEISSPSKNKSPVIRPRLLVCLYATSQSGGWVALCSSMTLPILQMWQRKPRYR